MVNFDAESNEHLKRTIDKRLKTNATLVNVEKTTSLSADSLTQYFNTVLRSPQLAKINALLTTPYPLTDDSFVKAKIATLVDTKHMEAYQKSLGKIINVFYQALDTGIPQENEQAIALNGTGFPAFVDANNQLVAIETLEKIQLQHMQKDLNELHKRFPTAQFSVAIIEGLTPGKEQPAKCNAVEAEVNKMNSQTNCHFYLKAVLSIASACVSISAIVVASLALASILTVSTAGVAALFTAAAITAGLATFGLFHKKSNAADEPLECAHELNV